MRTRTACSFVLAVAVAVVLSTKPVVRADEGMWTFDNPPLKLLQDRYHFVATPAWLDNLQLSSVRFSDVGSGAFVSPTGLVLTNDHVARGPLNFVCTCDVTGGNSGLPVVDRNGVLVGVIYANVESLAGPYLYSEATNRALAVRTAVMIKALRNVYAAGVLADELLH